MKEALRRLLDDFDEIEADHGEVYETDVREAIGLCLRNTLFSPKPGYQIPRNFEMVTDKGNALVRAALERFLKHPDAVALAESALSPAERLAAFEDRSVRSSRGNSLNETIGLLNGP